MSDRIDGICCVLTAFLVLGLITAFCVIFFDIERTADSLIVDIQVTDAYMHGPRRWATLKNGKVVKIWPGQKIGDMYYIERTVLGSWLR